MPLHMPFVNGLFQSASVWFMAIISHGVNEISSKSSLIVTRDIHATIDVGISSNVNFEAFSLFPVAETSRHGPGYRRTSPY